MKVKLLLLIFASALLTATSNGQDDYRSRQKDLSWGAKSDAFQMAAWTNPTTDTIFFAVRNALRKKVCYCKSYYGYPIKFYARKTAASEWQEIKPKPLTSEEIEKSNYVEVSLCFNTTLKPNEEIPLPEQFQNTAQNKNYLHSIDLRRLVFPADWSGAVEFKVTATFVNCSKVVEVESPIVKIKLPFSNCPVRIPVEHPTIISTLDIYPHILPSTQQSATQKPENLFFKKKAKR